jgi:hypothetical protein
MSEPYCGDMTNVSNLLATSELKRPAMPPMETAPVEFSPHLPDIPTSMTAQQASAPR